MKKHPFIITTNKNPAEWASMLGDEVLATALLDRLLFQCEVIIFLLLLPERILARIATLALGRLSHRKNILASEFVENKLNLRYEIINEKERR